MKTSREKAKNNNFKIAAQLITPRNSVAPAYGVSIEIYMISPKVPLVIVKKDDTLMKQTTRSRDRTEISASLTASILPASVLSLKMVSRNDDAEPETHSVISQ